MPRIVFISDTHLQKNFEIPGGDILVHAGDHTWNGNVPELNVALQWFSSQPHKHKIFIAGNHDRLFETDPGLAKSLVPDNCIYLQDDECTVEGIRFWGAPWTPAFCGWAFNLPRGQALKEKWALIPPGIDVVITHGPPYGILDKTPDHYERPGHPVGCHDLRNRMIDLKPRIHVFGHIHCKHGMKTVRGTTYINASVCNEKYHAVNTPLGVYLDA